MNKDKGSRGEVEVTYSVCMLLLKLADGGMVAGKDVVVDGGKVGRALLELAGADSKEFFS